MWKSIRSSVRDLFELRVGVGFTGKKKTEAKMHARLACLLPSRRPCCILRPWERQSHSQGAAGGSQESQDAAGGSQESQDAGRRAKTGPEWSLPPLGHNLAETFGWSSAVVVGWYMSHPLAWHSLFGQRYNNQRRCSDWWRAFIGRPTTLPVLPNAGFGQVRASRGSIDSYSSVSSFSELGSSDSVTTDGDDEWPNLRGPFTPLEALDEATREFAAICRQREAIVENEIGLDYMKRGRHRCALKHFERASILEHDHAAYNIGQCYELGLGSKRSIRKAAEWYKVAAERGHPTAMYNLGVFCARGLGGMPADQEEARKYFAGAAQLGHVEAQAALEMMETSKAADVSSEVDLNTIPTPTQVLLDMLGVENDTKSTLTVNTNGKKYAGSLHWLDLSLPVEKDDKSATGPEASAWARVGDDTLVATCRRFLDKVHSTLSFENSPSTEAAL